MSTSPEDRLSWRTIETRVPLDDLPAFHRAFLSWRGVEEAQQMPLRRVQQRVEAELNKLVRDGSAERVGDDVLISREALSEFDRIHPSWL